MTPAADPSLAQPAPPQNRSDRRAAWLLFGASLLVYAWFFQGPGYNQNAHFNTVRALVEQRSFEITRYTLPGAPRYTQDVSRAGDKIFSNKPPGLPLAAAPAYALVVAVQKARGQQLDDPGVRRASSYVVTVWASGVPGAVLAVVVFYFFRRVGSDLDEALLLAGAFAFGTLVLPYAGILMVHSLVALCLFGGWMCVTSPRPSLRRDAAGGALLGLGLMTEYLAGPLLLLLGAMLWRRRGRVVNRIVFAAPIALAAAALAAFHLVNFGSAATSTYTAQQNEFRQAGLLLGVFDWPDPRRLYWLTFHPFRGLFYCCPVLILSLFAFAAPMTRVRSLLRWGWLPLAVCAYYLLFNLTFNGWTGGWSVGPRYLIPAIPFLFVFAREGMHRFSRTAAVLMALSILNMIAVAAVRLMFPANNFGPPPTSEVDANPVAQCIKRLTMGQLARSDESFNLGMLLGLSGVASIVPVIVLIAGYFAVVIWLRHRRRAAEAKIA